MEPIKIKCPNCAHLFPVEDAFLIQAEEQIKNEYEKKAAKQAQEFKDQKDLLEKQRSELENEKNSQAKIIDDRVQEKLESEKLKYDELKSGEYEEKLKALEDENEKRRLENKALKQKELELLKREKWLKEQQEEFKLNVEREMLEKHDEIADEIRKQEQEKNSLKIKEYDKKFEDQKHLIEEMQRKIEQGSMQMQGEVQELALEDILRSQYRFDIIEEVPKGVSGADVIQTVVNSFQQVCGKIIYESKRTKSFSEGWIDKLKEDQRSQQADLAIIITEALPKGVDKFVLKDGVWICSYLEAKGLSFVLREMIIKTHSVKSAEENKGDKMSLLYNYLVSNDFHQRIEAIVEGFSGMKDDLEKEKRAMQKIWKEREKQIEKVTSNTIDMYGSIKGIAGNSIGSVKALELT